MWLYKLSAGFYIEHHINHNLVNPPIPKVNEDFDNTDVTIVIGASDAVSR